MCDLIFEFSALLLGIWLFKYFVTGSCNLKAQISQVSGCKHMKCYLKKIRIKIVNKKNYYQDVKFFLEVSSPNLFIKVLVEKHESTN